MFDNENVSSVECVEPGAFGFPTRMAGNRGVSGFRYALELVMRLRAGGLLWMAPVCSSFVFANSVKCLRQPPDYEGDTDYSPVVGGNLMAQVSAFFMLLAARRAIYAGMENPAGSTIFNFVPVRNILEALQVVYQTTDSCAFSKLPFGRRSLQRFMVAASGEWIQNIARRCRCPDKSHAELMKTGPDGRVSGTPALKLSQAYSTAFGAHIIRCWEEGAKIKSPACQVPQVSEVSERQGVTGLKRSAPDLSWTSPAFLASAKAATSIAVSSSACAGWTEPFTPAKTSKTSKKSSASSTSSTKVENWQTFCYGQLP